MMRTSIVVGLLALLAACGETATAPARPLPTSARYTANGGADVLKAREEQTYADTITTCEGDTAAVEADFVRRQQLVILPDTGVRITDHVTVRMRGTVMSSGVKYVGELSWIDVHVSRPSEDGVVAVETRMIRLHRVTQGPSDNMFETITFETIYDGSGGDTVVIKGKVACPG